jgi:pyruvate kinase
LKKILCTLGPASLDARTLRRFDELEVDVLRINLSHTEFDQIEPWVRMIREHARAPICLDTQGAQVRTGRLAGGSLTLEANATVELVATPAEGGPGRLPLYPGFVVGDLHVGDLVSIDFDSALLQVVETGPRSLARVLSAGRIGSNKAVSLDRATALPPLTEVDERALTLGRRLGLRHVALSFTNRKGDVELARRFAGPDAEIIAKVETRQALERLEEILDAADAILIDRGDLSREIPIESIPLVQKEVIRRANVAGVPVYVATNLLESMIAGSRPTRAEVNDVINTLIDGADGLVLAAETAIGRNPIGCVTMIRALIRQFEQRRIGGLEPPWSDVHESSASRLVPPHGGTLVTGVAPHLDAAAIVSLQRLDVDERVMMDVRQLAIGAFSPLAGFMDREMLARVLAEHRLPSGTVWPLPILLQLPAGRGDRYASGETLAVADAGEVRALLRVSECYRWDLSDLAARWFGTDDAAHPGVARLRQGSDWFLAGEVALLPDELRRRRPYELTPAQARLVFEHRQWQKVVGFHTRNVPHRVHEHLQLTALAEHHCDGIFVHPVIGPKKSGDCTGDIILKSYQLLIRDHYPPNAAIVAGWAAYSRCAGPREALFTALVRQNYGCSHFIVGRDHTGVGAFYPPEQSRRFCESLAGEVGVQLVFSEEVYHCERCGRHVQRCEHGRRYSEQISGTQARETLRQGRMLPDWFMREDVSRLILDELRQGAEVFVA